MLARFLWLWVALATWAAQADTEMEFSGTLIADPCVITTGDEEQTIDMGSIAAKTYMAHPRSAPSTFTIGLAECDLSLGNTVIASFSGARDNAQPGTFAVTGEARGIAIALESERGTAILPGEPLTAVDLVPGSNQLNYRAYVQGADYSKVMEGPFEARVIFTLEYE